MDFSPLQTTQRADPAYARARTQAEELEGVFLLSLVKEMFASIKTDGDFGGGFGEETWRSMQAEQMAQSMAAAGGIGLADQIMGDLIAVQEMSQSQMRTNRAVPGVSGVYH